MYFLHVLPVFAFRSVETVAGAELQYAHNVLSASSISVMPIESAAELLKFLAGSALSYHCFHLIVVIGLGAKSCQ
jgi:hypothetical protein